jgi:hypothetical protein
MFNATRNACAAVWLTGLRFALKGWLKHDRQSCVVTGHGSVPYNHRKESSGFHYREHRLCCHLNTTATLSLAYNLNSWPGYRPNTKSKGDDLR